MAFGRRSSGGWPRLRRSRRCSAKRTGAALIAASLYTDGPGKWRMIFSPPFDLPNDNVPSLTAKMNEMIAAEIRRAPEDWFWVHNRWKTPRPNWLLEKYKRGLFVPETVGTKGLKPFRILIRGSNWLGDSVISVPAVRAIKHGRPDAHVTVLAPEKIAAVWRLVPEVDEVISLGRKSLWHAVDLIRNEPEFDAGVVFPNSFRVALELWLAGVPRRVGYAGHRRRWLLNQIVRKPERKGPPPHQVEHYLDIARSLGGEARVEEIAIPPRPSAKPAELRLGLCPGAEYGPAKRWLPERFAATAARDWRTVGSFRHGPGRGGGRSNRRDTGRWLHQSHRSHDARATDRGTSEVSAAFDERHRHDASRDFAWGSGRGGFWFDRAEPDRSVREGKSDHQASGRMQPVFSARMSARLSLHESGERRGSGGGDS